MQKNYAAIQAAGAEVIAISSDGEAATKQNAQNQGVKFPLLSDPDVATISDYNVVDLFNPRIARTSYYVLKQDGTITWKSIHNKADKVPVAQILQELGKL